MEPDALRSLVINATARGFHAKDGWHFQRQEDGSVLVTLTSDDGLTPLEWVLLDPGTWASVVASVCAQGETAETFAAAQAMHHPGRDHPSDHSETE